MVRKKKIKKILPIGILLLIVISVTGWAMKQLVYLSLKNLPMLSGMTEIQQNIVIVVTGLGILILVGYRIEKILK